MNGLKNKDLTILVVSYDGYSDMWPDFFNCKKINWPDCPFETVIANNEKSFDFDNVRVINCGKSAQWSTRTRIALEAINTKYVCFLLEDFFISEKVDTSVINDVLTTMESNNLKYYKLMSLSKIATPYFDKHKGERTIPANLKYGVSLLAAIWDREYFLSLVGKEDYNPWRFEIERNQDAEAAGTDTTLCGLYNEKNILKICHMVVQGKYLPSSVKRMRSLGFDINVGERGCHSCFYEYKNSLKDKLYPLLRKSRIASSIAAALGVETVTSKNQSKK